MNYALLTDKAFIEQPFRKEGFFAKASKKQVYVNHNVGTALNAADCGDDIVATTGSLVRQYDTSSLT